MKRWEVHVAAPGHPVRRYVVRADTREQAEQDAGRQARIAAGLAPWRYLNREMAEHATAEPYEDLPRRGRGRA